MQLVAVQNKILIINGRLKAKTTRWPKNHFANSHKPNLIKYFLHLRKHKNKIRPHIQCWSSDYLTCLYCGPSQLDIVAVILFYYIFFIYTPSASLDDKVFIVEYICWMFCQVDLCFTAGGNHSIQQKTYWNFGIYQWRQYIYLSPCSGKH